MTDTRVEVKVHTSYVQTCVRFYGEDTGLTYQEYGRFGASVPRGVFTCATEDELKTFMGATTGDVQPQDHVYLPEFDGFLSLVAVFTDPSDLSQFEIEEARYIDVKKGGRDVKGAFRDPKFKRPILDNLLKQIADKNVVKIRGVLGALDIVGA